MQFRQKNPWPREAGTSTRPPGDHQGDCTFQHAAQREGGRGGLRQTTAQQCGGPGAREGWRSLKSSAVHCIIKIPSSVSSPSRPNWQLKLHLISTQFCPVKTDVRETVSRPQPDIAADCSHLALLSQWAVGIVQAVRLSCLTGSLQ